MITQSQEGRGTATGAEAGFDQARLRQWLEQNLQGFEGPIKIERFAGGQSNPTFKLTTAAGNFVLRKKPSGVLLKGAHAIERESRAMSALGNVGFPVARVHAICVDEAVIGARFYVMEYVQGRIFWDATFPQVSRQQRPLYFDAMNAVLARLHAIDPVTVDLGDYGHPGNFFQRQVTRWSRQYLEDLEPGRDPNMDRLIEWLPAHIPAGDEVSVVHGDFRCDNLIFHPTEPKVLAVLDWELSTLGHPLADFTYHTMMYRMPAHIVAGLQGEDLVALNIPSEAEYVAAYCNRVGRKAIADYDFHVAFNFFRLAAIFHGIRGRIARGTAASAQAVNRAALFPEVARLAWAQAQRADKLWCSTSQSSAPTS